MDVIPEQIYGPYGYIDDIYMSVYALKEVASVYGYEFLQEVWDKDNDIKEVIEECYNKSVEVLEEDDIEAILTYIGLK